MVLETWALPVVFNVMNLGEEDREVLKGVTCRPWLAHASQNKALSIFLRESSNQKWRWVPRVIPFGSVSSVHMGFAMTHVRQVKKEPGSSQSRRARNAGAFSAAMAGVLPLRTCPRKLYTRFVLALDLGISTLPLF